MTDVKKTVDFLASKSTGSLLYRRVSSSKKAYRIMADLYYRLEPENRSSFSATETKRGRKIVCVKTEQNTFSGFYDAQTKTLEVYLKKFPRERIQLSGQRPEGTKKEKPEVKINLEFINFEPLVTRKRITTRGGGVEIDLSSLGYPGHLMSAYQNYLGGGILGGIGTDCTAEWDDSLRKVANQLKLYYADLAGLDADVYKGMPMSAY